jgi:hypothetical protein
VTVRAGTKQSGARNRTTGEIERTRELRRQRIGDRALHVGCPAFEIVDGKLPARGTLHRLHRLAVTRPEHRTQNVMALPDSRQRRFERAMIERSEQPRENRQIVRRASRLDLIEKPQTLLSE